MPLPPRFPAGAAGGVGKKEGARDIGEERRSLRERARLPQTRGIPFSSSFLFFPPLLETRATRRNATTAYASVPATGGGRTYVLIRGSNVRRCSRNYFGSFDFHCRRLDGNRISPVSLQLRRRPREIVSGSSNSGGVV